MTKEEIIQKGEKKFPPDIIEEIGEDGSIVQTDVNATVRHAYVQGLIDNNCQLPSDIDEAAEFDKMFEDFCDQHPDGLTLNECAEFFYDKGKQVGAEWMAGQGETLESLIWRDEDDKLFIEAFVDENKFKMADNVTIQIRKKQ